MNGPFDVTYCHSDEMSHSTKGFSTKSHGSLFDNPLKTQFEVFTETKRMHAQAADVDLPGGYFI